MVLSIFRKKIAGVIMNRTEQKSMIKDILLTINDVKTSLENKENGIQKALNLAGELEDALQELDAVDAFDIDDFTEKLLQDVFAEELSLAYDEIDNFKMELDSYISELSESRAEKLEERYASLDEVLEKFDQSIQEYCSVENALEHIDEAIDMLKNML